MAVCPACDQDMTLGVSCTGEPYADAPDKPRIPRQDEYPKCHDCGTPPGGYHHPGCDDERCPTCRGQAISCGCGRPAEDDE